MMFLLNARRSRRSAKAKKADRETLPARDLRGGAFVPGIGMNDVAVFVGPVIFFVAQLNLLQMVVLLKKKDP